MVSMSPRVSPMSSSSWSESLASTLRVLRFRFHERTGFIAEFKILATRDSNTSTLADTGAVAIAAIFDPFRGLSGSLFLLGYRRSLSPDNCSFRNSALR